MTRDYLPKFHKLGANGYAWAGCNGRAVGLSVALGREFARAIQGTPDNDLALPFSDPAPIPFHGLARRLSRLMLLEYKRRDRREI
jgi:glycine/D-amino acid oxidase-like deaminating enzyme